MNHLIGIWQRTRRIALLSTAALLAPVANAFFDPPEVTPERPSTDSIIDVRIRAGLCDTFLTTGPQDRELEIVGNRVLIRVLGFSTSDTAQCNAPPLTFRYRIGTLPVGTYQLEIYRRQFMVPTQVDLVGTASFVVEAGSSVPIPAIGNRGAFVLLMLLGGAGLYGLWARRS